jgi:phage shock protein PspC (stress-responsive transcriptional regulator)
MDDHPLPRDRWLRDPANGYLGGVCAGVAARLRVPALVVRIAAVAALVMWPRLVLIAYLAAWVLVDSRDELPRKGRQQHCQRLALRRRCHHSS